VKPQIAMKQDVSILKRLILSELIIYLKVFLGGVLGQVVPVVYAVREQETEKEVVRMVHRVTTVMVRY